MNRRNGNTHRRVTTVLLCAAFLLAFAPSRAAAQITFGTANLVEWNGPPGTNPDLGPGAVSLNNGQLWYVTRVGNGPRVIRFTPGSPMATAPGSFTSWEMDPATAFSNGVRLRASGNYAFARALSDIQRIDTSANTRARWVDNMTSFSDIAVANGLSSCSSTTCVYTTGHVSTGFNGTDSNQDVVQRLCPGTGTNPATVTRWIVGGGAGSVYLSGVDVNPLTTQLVYYSEPDTNNIGELNVTTGTVRRWSTASLGALQPRQLRVAPGGIVWVVTGSGHLVSLNPTTNLMTAFMIPLSTANDPFGLDPDGVIGYTTANPGLSKVGMLIPDGLPQPIGPSLNMPPVTVASGTLSGTSVGVPPVTDTAPPDPKTTLATITDDPIDGTYVEADLSAVGSTGPLGVAHDPAGLVGSYFYAVGDSLNRIGYATLPTPAAGLVTGGGWIPEGTSNSTFGFVAQRKTLGGTVKGHLTYQNHLSGDQVQSLQITDLEFLNNTATFSGTCQTGCMLNFRVDVVDNGQPNNTPRDTFQITKDSIGGIGGVSDAGTLQGGNIMIHRQQ